MKTTVQSFDDRGNEENIWEPNQAFKPEVRCFKPEVENAARQKRAGERTSLSVRYFDKLLWLSEAN